MLLFVQLAFILLACKAVGSLACRLGQPRVVGEMIAGVMMGPSLFGLLFPELQENFFPKESKTVLYCLAHIGLSLYMFVVGMEFRTDLLRTKLRGAVFISLAGILAPFAMGAIMGWWLFERGGFFTNKVTLGQSLLFLGTSMSITAFPMLARIIVERGLSGSTMGTLSLAAGSIDDAIAWLILALILASFGGDAMVFPIALGGGIGYGVVILGFVRPYLARMALRMAEQKRAPAEALSLLLILLMLGAWFTDFIQLYAVFGAFLLGVAVPKGDFASSIRKQIEPLTLGLLLPLFFIYSGLNTRLDLINSFSVIVVTLCVLAIAILGKWGACGLAARMTGETWRDSMAIGSLMNARGLMELIILNIGLERGLITNTLFSVMVVMAIVTTLIATPLFERFTKHPGDAHQAVSDDVQRS